MNTQNRVSLHRRRNLTLVSNVCTAAAISLFFVLVPDGLNELPEMGFIISFHSDWQINNGFFNRPIMGHTQILVQRWWPRTRISAIVHNFFYLLNQSLVSSMTKAKIMPELTNYIFVLLITDTNHCLHVIF